MFSLNSIRRLQTLNDLYRWGALLQQFGVRGKPRSVERTELRRLMSFNMRICFKNHHIDNSAFFICFIFLLRLLQQVLFRIRDIPANQIIISTYE